MFSDIGMSQGMGEQQKQVLDEKMDKEVRNQTYVLVNERVLIYVFLTILLQDCRVIQCMMMVQTMNTSR